jgi:hypothetical protein
MGEYSRGDDQKATLLLALQAIFKTGARRKDRPGRTDRPLVAA